MWQGSASQFIARLSVTVFVDGHLGEQTKDMALASLTDEYRGR